MSHKKKKGSPAGSGIAGIHRCKVGGEPECLVEEIGSSPDFTKGRCISVCLTTSLNDRIGVRQATAIHKIIASELEDDGRI